MLSLPDDADPANTTDTFGGARDLALLEEVSQVLCVNVKPSGTIDWDKKAMPDPADPANACVDKQMQPTASVPFGPKAAVLGNNRRQPSGSVTLWSDPIVTNPALDSTETWELWNWSADAHPIHLHLVKFKVVNREPFNTATGDLQGPVDPALTEAGWKDTVIAYPGQVTRVNATFDIAGLYVWHCHILEHEDNEMMVPYCVGDKGTAPGCNAVP